MKLRSLQSKKNLRRIICKNQIIAGVLLLMTWPIAVAASQSQSKPKPDRATVTVSITQIGDLVAERTNDIGPCGTTRVTYRASGRVLPRSGTERYYLRVSAKETLAGSVSGITKPMTVYTLVRLEGQRDWTVQEGASRLAPGATRWQQEARFGYESQEGLTFELRSIVTSARLPSGTLPLGVLDRATVASSKTIYARRAIKGKRPLIWITSVNGQAVYGEKITEVQEESPVEIETRDLPEGAEIFVAVQPIKPLNQNHWVMDDSLIARQGAINTHFAEPGTFDNHIFEITAFAAWPGNAPPAGRTLGEDEWDCYRAGFLAQSRVVRAIRWNGKLRIEQILTSTPSQGRANRTLLRGDIYGTVDRYLKGEERVWVIALPATGTPWIAGWARTQSREHVWIVKSAQLSSATASGVSFVAVVSASDPRNVQPGELWSWVQDSKHSSESFRIGK